MQNKGSATPMEDFEGMGGAQAPSLDLLAILRGVLRRWKLVAAITLCASIATYGVVKLIVPSRYKSTVEILVYDPQQQIDATVQKPVSPFVDALGNDAISTEINILKSKSVALRVAGELGLDTDPEFQSDDLRIGQLAKRIGLVAQRLGIQDLLERLGIANLAERVGIADLPERLGFTGLGAGYDNSAQTLGATDEKADRLDRAADELIKRLEISQDSFIISVSATARDPIEARRLASTIADDYLASQRDARQEALGHVADWIKGHIDNLQSRALETEASIEKLKVESGVRDSGLDKLKEEQIRDLNAQLMTARGEVSDTRARFEQAQYVIKTNGDIDTVPELNGTQIMRELRQNNGDFDGIPEVVASGALRQLRQRRMELNARLSDLQSRFGERNIQIVSARADLATVKKQIDTEVGNALATMKNAYDIAQRREQTLEANLRNLTANLNSENYIKLQQLQHAADSDRKDYESYLAQYNNISEQREMQSTSARIISPATLPRSPNSKRMKFYAIGGAVGLAGGLLLAFLLEYFKSGVRTSTEIAQAFGLSVVGFVPLVSRPKIRRAYHQPLHRAVNEPLSQLSEAVRSMRISLQLSIAGSKVILVTSALPGEGKSTAAMLLAASCASSGKKTVLLDCDLRLRSASEILRRKHQPGLSDFLTGTANLRDIINQDPATKINVIPAGSPTTPNAADLLMSQAMLDLIAALRHDFDYVIMDSPPLLPVVDALALATSTDKILVIIEWRRTSRDSIYEAFRVLGPEANRVAGVVLNKVDFNELPGHSGYRYYHSSAKYFSKA
jgi:polysaccharide biosynthesis transport protein